MKKTNYRNDAYVYINRSHTKLYYNKLFAFLKKCFYYFTEYLAVLALFGMVYFMICLVSVMEG